MRHKWRIKNGLRPKVCPSSSEDEEPHDTYTNDVVEAKTEVQEQQFEEDRSLNVEDDVVEVEEDCKDVVDTDVQILCQVLSTKSQVLCKIEDPHDQASFDPVEISLISSEEDEATVKVEESSSSSHTIPYGFRKRKITSMKEVSDSEEEKEADGNESRSTKNRNSQKPLNVLSMTERELGRFCSAGKKKLTNKKLTYWLVNTSVLNGRNRNIRFAKVLEFVKKCGGILEHLHWICGSSLKSNKKKQTLLSRILMSGRNLKKITLQYNSERDINSLLVNVKSSFEKGKLRELKSLRVTSLTGDGVLKKSTLEGLTQSKVPWEELQLGEFLWEDSGPEWLEELLEGLKDSLISLIIHGGFIGDNEKSTIQVKVPEMRNLKTLSICPKYSFKGGVNLKIPQEPIGVPVKLTLKITSEMASLKHVILGNFVEIEEIPFSFVRKLKTFKCGSDWHLGIKFPTGRFRSLLEGSEVISLQFPDGLKDPWVVQQIAKFFPNLKIVWINLPSLPVINSFFASFASTGIEELILKTQFDFPGMVESCLFPNDLEMCCRNPSSKKWIDMIKKYKWYEEYCTHFNVDLPSDEGVIVEGNTEGIRGLKSLKRFHIQHVFRTPLRFPCPEEERRWDDPLCTFMKGSKIGYTFSELYPFKMKCHNEILKMSLNQYTWMNTRSYWNNPETQSLLGGYKDMNCSDISDSSDDEDLFSPIRKKFRMAVPTQQSLNSSKIKFEN